MGRPMLGFAVLFVTIVMSQFSWDFHYTGQEIHSEGYYSNLNSALESISFTMGPFRGWAPKLGSDSVYSKHNGPKQNRKELHIVFWPPLAICSFAHCCPSSCPTPASFQPLYTFHFTTPKPASRSAFRLSLNKNNNYSGAQTHSQEVLPKHL